MLTINDAPAALSPAGALRWLAHKLEQAAETAADHADLCRSGSMLIDLRHAAEAYAAAANHKRAAAGYMAQAYGLEGREIDRCVSGWHAGDAACYDVAAADAREEYARRQAQVAATIPAFLVNQGATI
jgi:hypothetical protein